MKANGLNKSYTPMREGLVIMLLMILHITCEFH